MPIYFRRLTETRKKNVSGGLNDFFMIKVNRTEANLEAGQDFGSLYQPKTWALAEILVISNCKMLR